MNELVEDPRIAEAALALLDECYAEAQTIVVCVEQTPTPSPSLSLRKRAHEELTWLRATVLELEQRGLQKRYQAQSQYSITNNENDTANNHARKEPLSPTTRAQATCFLQAVQSYNRLQPEMILTAAATDRITLRLVDDTQLVGTLRSQLDTLYKIAKATSTISPDVSDAPPVTDVGFRDQARSVARLPYKLSTVADVFWRFWLGTLYGSYNETPLAAQLHNEVMFEVTRRRQLPSGSMASSGLTAVRRVYEEDGSVLILYTTVTSAPALSRQLLRKSDSSDLPNLLAGITMKEAGWTRIRRPPSRNHVRRDRPLVLLESAQSIVVETSSGKPVPKQRLLRLWDTILEASAQEPYSNQSTENRLLDASFAK